MKSVQGAMLARAELYAYDSEGRWIKHVSPSLWLMKLSETRSYVEPAATDRESQEERMEREGRSLAITASLTDLERRVLRLQGKLQTRVEKRVVIAAGDLVEYQRAGYTLIPGTADVAERKGLPNVDTVEVVGVEYEQHEAMDYGEIAALLELTYWQVQRAVKSANRKIRGMR